MSFDENTTRVIAGALALIAAVVGGAFISKKISKNRSTKSELKDITITGDGNKIVGGDDNSKNTNEK